MRFKDDKNTSLVIVNQINVGRNLNHHMDIDKSLACVIIGKIIWQRIETYHSGVIR